MSIDQLDPQDRAILQVLQTDGRMSNAALAERVNLSPSACLRRVGLLEAQGLINRYVMLIDERTAGFTGTAYVSVTLEQQGGKALDRFEAAVVAHPEILECHLLAGSADYLLRVVYRDAADLERIHRQVITQLPGVVRVQSTLTLRTVKKTTALPI